MMSFSSSGGCREAADIKIDRCQHAAIPDTTKDIDNCGWCEDLQTRTRSSLVRWKRREVRRVFAGLHALTCHFSVSGAS